MNPADPARSHDPYPWLAGYVDGELDPATRRRVEAWVEQDPVAADELRTQDSLGPDATDFWPKVEPPALCEATWAAVGEGIADRLHPVTLSPARPQKRSRIGWYAGLAASVALLAGAWWQFAGERRQQVVEAPPRSIEIVTAPREVAPAVEVAEAPLDLARPGDAIVESVRGDVSPWLIGFERYVPEAMAFAEPGDVVIEKVQPQSAAKPPVMKMMTEPSDTPMIYVALPRSR